MKQGFGGVVNIQMPEKAYYTGILLFERFKRGAENTHEFFYLTSRFNEGRHDVIVSKSM